MTVTNCSGASGESEHTQSRRAENARSRGGVAVAVLRRSGPIGEVSHRVALIRKKVRSAVLDVRYRGLLNGSIPTRYGHLGAMEVASTDYDALSAIFAGVIR